MATMPFNKNLTDSKEYTSN